MHDPLTVEDLTLKSGALQAAVCIDYPFDHRFRALEVSYDGINGQLPNLDLINTAISIASGQMGMGACIQGTPNHDDSYRQRLVTLLKGMSSQALGHATGPHSVFMPYHIDAITLTTVGEGWEDEMALGRTIESICRSLNNLLEHLHQSFFFYLLMQANRFVSIGTYLPSAMAVAAAFTIMAINLWVRSSGAETEDMEEAHQEQVRKDPEIRVSKAWPEKVLGTASHPQQLLPSIAFVASMHVLGLLPLYLFNNIPREVRHSRVFERWKESVH